MQEEQQHPGQPPQETPEPFLASLRDLQNNINQDIEKMANLKFIYHEIQQKKFLQTFVSIMDKMSNELQRANQMYQSIDKEIAQNQQCKYLSKQLQYFQNQCVELKKTLRQKQQRLQAQKMREVMLKSEQEYLEGRLYQSTYKEMKYKSKLETLSKRKIDSLSGPIKSNRTFETRSKSMRLRNRSEIINDHLYEEIYKNRPKSLRRATSIRPQKSQNTTTYLPNKKSANLFTSFKQN